MRIRITRAELVAAHACQLDAFDASPNRVGDVVETTPEQWAERDPIGLLWAIRKGLVRLSYTEAIALVRAKHGADWEKTRGRPVA